MKTIFKTAEPMSQTRNAISFSQGNIRYISFSTMSAMSTRICNGYSTAGNLPYSCMKKMHEKKTKILTLESILYKFQKLIMKMITRTAMPMSVPFGTRINDCLWRSINATRDMSYTKNDFIEGTGSHSRYTKRNILK